MEVHDGHDSDHGGLDAEQNTEREGTCQAPTNIAFDNWVHLGIEFNPVESILYACEEAFPEVFLLRFVSHSSVDHLRIRLGMEANGFHASAAYALANTSAAS